MLTRLVRDLVLTGLVASLFIPSRVVADEPPSGDGIRANLARIAEAINTVNLDLYAENVTTDLVNMTVNLEGEVTTTVSRQARIDELTASFETSPFVRNAAMEPLEILVDGD